MKLITEETKRILPKLYEQDGKGWNAIAYIKFFTPDSSWTWYATEFDGEDIFFVLRLKRSFRLFNSFKKRSIFHISGRGLL